ncbi:MAG: isopropylmalate isomerase [Aphanocapsa feldmannii 277cV]|uniref:3-isopropylmalate dehydratase n=2 Tax=Aphanocapsa feldmannii TaxID=192050 RepID=A0A524RPH1_9CHRO|nr:MAG: isopropylmalate isomerase [Aphanocapsa feldmannii 277cV]
MANQIRRIERRAIALEGNDIDTDRIIPARFLKCVTFEGLGAWAFADDRTALAGCHPFDQDHHQGAGLLVVNRNFGCGSSREHAPQSLGRWGIQALIGESFAEIFSGNCLALGLPCCTTDSETISALQRAVAANPAADYHLDVEALTITGPGGSWPLTMPAAAHRMLTSGQWDVTGQLTARDAALRSTATRLPYLTGFTC